MFYSQTMYSTILLMACVISSRTLQAWIVPSTNSQTQRKIPSIHCGHITAERKSLLVLKNNNNNKKEFEVEVTYEGRTCRVPIQENETLLSGMERARVNDELSIFELPSDCRRGNCLTCVGRHSMNSSKESLLQGEDGLSPEISRQVSKEGYMLTCSSTVIGEGLKLELGVNHKAWNAVYCDRLHDDTTQYIARSAMARTIRRSDEKNPERWANETETALDKSEDIDSDSIPIM